MQMGIKLCMCFLTQEATLHASSQYKSHSTKLLGKQCGQEATLLSGFTLDFLWGSHPRAHPGSPQ